MQNGRDLFCADSQACCIEKEHFSPQTTPCKPCNEQLSAAKHKPLTDALKAGSSSNLKLRLDIKQVPQQITLMTENKRKRLCELKKIKKK